MINLFRTLPLARTAGKKIIAVLWRKGPTAALDDEYALAIRQVSEWSSPLIVRCLE